MSFLFLPSRMDCSLSCACGTTLISLGPCRSKAVACDEFSSLRDACSSIGQPARARPCFDKFRRRVWLHLYGAAFGLLVWATCFAFHMKHQTNNKRSCCTLQRSYVIHRYIPPQSTVTKSRLSICFRRVGVHIKGWYDKRFRRNCLVLNLASHCWPQ